MSHDPIDKLIVTPHCSLEFLAGMCAALSDDRGDVHLEICAVEGKPVAKFRRTRIDASLPVFLRKHAE